VPRALCASAVEGLTHLWAAHLAAMLLLAALLTKVRADQGKG
jgi:hypothetical protein